MVLLGDLNARIGHGEVLDGMGKYGVQKGMSKEIDC